MLIPRLYLAFADPMNTPGLMLSPSMTPGFRFVIMDVNYTEGDRVIELTRPRISTASPRCCAIPSDMWSNPLVSLLRASRPPPFPRRGCITLPASTPARTIR